MLYRNAPSPHRQHPLSEKVAEAAGAEKHTEAPGDQGADSRGRYVHRGPGERLARGVHRQREIRVFNNPCSAKGVVILYGCDSCFVNINNQTNKK